MNEILSETDKVICITTDAWSNIKNASVVNYMLVSPEQSIFLEAVQTGEEAHTANWIAGNLLWVITYMTCKVLGAVTDNTAPNKKAWSLLKEKFPTKFFHGCLAHTLHLMVKDIFLPPKKEKGPDGELRYPPTYPFEHLAIFATTCKEIVIFFHTHHVQQAQLQKVLEKASK